MPGYREQAVTRTKEGAGTFSSHRDRDQGDRQTFYNGVKRERELEHDVQVYRAYERHAERLEARGARIERVVLDYELKRDYQKWLHERDRDRDDYDHHPDRTAEEILSRKRRHDDPHLAHAIAQHRTLIGQFYYRAPAPAAAVVSPRSAPHGRIPVR